MRMLLLGCAFAFVALAAHSGAQASHDTGVAVNGLTRAQQALYLDAIEAFRAHRYSAAYGRFARLADAGHLTSAQIALVMVKNGHTLFDYDWDATPEQVERWNALIREDACGRGSACLAD